jgi:hypothetical protein
MMRYKAKQETRTWKTVKNTKNPETPAPNGSLISLFLCAEIVKDFLLTREVNLVTTLSEHEQQLGNGLLIQQKEETSTSSFLSRLRMIQTESNSIRPCLRIALDQWIRLMIRYR